MLGADMGTEGSGEGHPVHRVDVHLVHQKPRACVKRGFRQLDRADVALQDSDPGAAVHAGIMQKIAEGPAMRLAAAGPGLLGSADQPAGVEKPCEAHFGDRLDDA
jgi:hypothetical protein